MRAQSLRCALLTLSSYDLLIDEYRNIKDNIDETIY